LFESVGVNTVEITEVEVSFGVQLQIAWPFVVDRELQPKILVPAFLKLKVPGIVEVAVRETGEP
jgi:hypothetical protein